MSYTYYTDEEATQAFDLPVDYFGDIVLEDTMPASVLVAIRNRTKGRLSMNIEGIIAECSYVNFYRTETSGKLRFDNETGSLSILDRVFTYVVVS